MILSSDITGGFVSFRFFSPISLLSNTIYISDESDLLLWDDDLGGEGVLRVWHGVIEETNASNDLTDLAGTIGSIRRIAVNLSMSRKINLIWATKCLT